MSHMETALSKKIAELEEINETIQKLKREQKEKKQQLDDHLNFFGLKYERCTNCKATGLDESGETCSVCGGAKIVLVPMDGGSANESGEESED